MLIIQTILLQLFFLGVVFSQQPVAEKSKPIRLTASIELKKLAGSSMMFYTKVDLGELLAGKKYVLDLTLTNNNMSPVPIVGVKSSCSCLAAKFPQVTLEPGDSMSGEILFRVPLQSATGKFQSRIEFYVDRKTPPIGAMNFSGTIAGNLYTGGARVNLLEIRESLGQWDIPIFFSKPITLEALQVEKSPGLEDVAVQLVSENGRNLVRITVHEKMVDDVGISGAIELQHKPTGQTRPIAVAISRPPPFRLSPSTLHFSTVKNEADELRAIAMLQLNTHRLASGSKEPDEQTDDSKKGQTINSVQLKISGKPIPVKVTRLGTSQVYKLTVKCSREFLNELSVESNGEREETKLNQVVWLIRTTRSTFRVKGDFRPVLGKGKLK